MTNELRKHLFELLEKYKDKSNKLFEAGKVLTDCVKAKGIICCEACDKKISAWITVIMIAAFIKKNYLASF